MQKTLETLPSPFKRVLPECLKVGKDRLIMRLDFYSEAIVMQEFDKKGGGFKMVSASDLAHAMANELFFASGLLPENALWWSNGHNGPVVAVWNPPGIRRLALQMEVTGPPERYDVPLPGLIFLCTPGQPPWVYAVGRRPEGLKDRVYKAPLANVYNDGKTCPGSHRYPANLAEIPDSFFRSFFSHGANLQDRSKKHPNDITLMWKDLHKQKEYPLADLVYHGTISDLMGQRV